VSWTGGSFGAHGQCVVADNASVMTLDGTNTWVLREHDGGRSVVVDPGPLDEAHLAAALAAAGDVVSVLLTHHHLDHSEGARRFAELAGCGVRALDPAYRLGDEGLRDGDVVGVGDLEVEVVGTPGHTSDSLSFLVRNDRAVLTGDTVLGRGTTVVAHPDGELGAYLSSLDRLHRLAETREISTVWPGHGPVIEDALTVLDHYIAHRHERLDQVREALRQLEEGWVPGPALDAAVDTAGNAADNNSGNRADSRAGNDAGLARAIVEKVYVDVDPVLWGAAELSVRAQLAYLKSR
jgi:glyoxylase-like metal-dependent hydrolase (beta-lactamase superfamily II)